MFKSPSPSNHSSEVYLRILHIIVEKPTEYTEWQRPLSGVHSIMMGKLTHDGEGGGCTPILFHYTYHHVQSCCVRSSWKGRCTPPISTRSLYVLCEEACQVCYQQSASWLFSAPNSWSGAMSSNPRWVDTGYTSWRWKTSLCPSLHCKKGEPFFRPQTGYL